MVWSMLKSKKFPKELWAKPVAYAVYLSYWSLVRSVCGKTPGEACSGRKCDIKHLRVLRSVSQVRIWDEKKTKLDDKSDKFIFVGYDQSSKGYTLYNPKNNKIVINWDVVLINKDSGTLVLNRKNTISLKNLKKKRLKKFNNKLTYQHRPFLKTLQMKGV